MEQAIEEDKKAQACFRVPLTVTAVRFDAIKIRQDALSVLRAKGYAVTHYFLGSKPGERDRPQWDADKDGRSFSATTPEELLGLIAMWEVRGNDWRLKPSEAELYDRLVEEALMYDSDGNVVDT